MYACKVTWARADFKFWLMYMLIGQCAASTHPFSMGTIPLDSPALWLPVHTRFYPIRVTPAVFTGR